MPWGVVGPMEAPAEAAEEAPKEGAKEAMEEAMEEVNCHAGGGGLAVDNAVGGDFAVHRRLVLAVAMEVGEREGGEDLTAGNAAGGGVGRATAAGGGAGGAVEGRGVVVDEGPIYLAKASWTTLWIITFNSSSCFDVKAMLLT